MLKSVDAPAGAFAPDRDGRYFIVTGATSGIGRVTARLLVARGARVVVAGRSLDKCDVVAAELRATGDPARVQTLPLDLADLASVRAAAATVLQRGWPIAALINN